jgi:hypothetical protein
VLVGAIVCALLAPGRPQATSLSLVFEKYGISMDSNFDFQDVAFLWFTNGSAKSYCLPMAGRTNTFQRDALSMRIGHDSEGSYLINTEFSGEVNSNAPASWSRFGVCQVVNAHAAIRLRVPLPPLGQKRKVAVYCAEMPSGSPSLFWTKGVGLAILRMLPRSIGMKLLFTEPKVLKVWSDRELEGPEASGK